MIKKIGENWQIYFSVLFVMTGLGVVGPILHDIQVYFKLESAARTSLVISVFAFTRLLLDIPSSFLTRRLNLEWVLCWGAVLVIAGSLITALAPDYSFLLLGRAVAGGGSALTIISAVVMLNKKADSQNRGSLLATYQAFLLGGVSLGPALGGLAAYAFNWRAAFWTGCLAGLLALACNIGLLRKPVNGESRPAVRDDGECGVQNINNNSRLERTFWIDVIAVNFVTFVLLFVLEGFNNTIIPLYGSRVLGLEPGVLGIILGAMAVVRFAVSLFGGVLSDKYGRGAILIPCLLVAGIGTMCLKFADTTAVFVIVAALFAFGRMGNNINLALLGDVTPPDRMGMMIGINRFFCDLGLVLGPWFLGMVVDIWGFEASGIVVGAAAWLMAFIVWKFFGLGIPGRQSTAGRVENE
ncbi:MFS transporter [Desulfocucumis palustris]|nr:MFS transporter [Desulfocucumis palustris]